MGRHLRQVSMVWAIHKIRLLLDRTSAGAVDMMRAIEARWTEEHP